MKAKEVRIVKEVKKEWWLVTFCLWRSFFVENQIEAEQILETLKKSLSIPSCTKRRIPGEYPIRFAQSFPSNPFSIKIRLKWSENSDIRWSVVPFRILCLTRQGDLETHHKMQLQIYLCFEEEDVAKFDPPWTLRKH